MDILACKFCKKPFSSTGKKICPICLEQLDKDVITIRDYIDENPGASIDDISEETEVPRQRIMYLIKEGRLIIDSADGEGGGLLHCELCKKPINTGRYCDNCKKTLSKTIGSKMSAPQQGKSAAPAADFRSRAKFGKK